MKKLNIIKNLLVPSTLTLTGVLAISCSNSKKQETTTPPDVTPPDVTPPIDPTPPTQEEAFVQKFSLPFNYFIEDKNSKIFDEQKWKEKGFSKDIDINFIKSTIVENEKFKLVFPKNANDYIFKNEDLKFVSFLYKYNNMSLWRNKEHWFVQTVYFENSKDTSLKQQQLSLSDYWNLAEEKGKSDTVGETPYKKSFLNTIVMNQNIDSENNSSRIQKNETLMPQLGTSYISIPNFVAGTKFNNYNENNRKTIANFDVNDIYGKGSNFVWQTNLKLKYIIGSNQEKERDLGSIQYLTNDLKIWKITKENQTYIKFIFGKGAVKVSLIEYENKNTPVTNDYFNDTEIEFYINITNWME